MNQYNIKFEGTDANHQPRSGTIAVEDTSADEALTQGTIMVMDMYPGFNGRVSALIHQDIPQPLPVAPTEADTFDPAPDTTL